MRPATFAPWTFLAALSLAACSGNCGGCAGLNPIPQPFDVDARVDRGVQVRLSRTGLDFLENQFASLATSFIEPTCGGADDVPCATAFGAVCDPVRGVCVDGAGASVPTLGFEIEYAVSGDAVVCRDPPNDPNRRECHAWLYLEDLQLTPAPTTAVDAVVTARVVTTEIPIRYDRGILDLDCLVTVDSTSAGAPSQDLEVQLALSEYGADRRLRLDVASVSAMVPDEDLTIVEDPIAGTAGDVIACRGINAIGSLKQIILNQITDSLADLVAEQLDEALGATCLVQADCPASTTCNSDNFCEEASGRVIPAALGIEGRLDAAALLGSLAAGAAGNIDLAFAVGGSSSTDSTGVVVSTLVGMEHTGQLADCAVDSPSPRLRPSFVSPEAIPAEDQVDFDGDGVPETPFMVALGLSGAAIEQGVWSVYRTGTFCFALDSSQVGQLNTGALSLVLPSLAQLTRRDKYPEAVFPVRVGLLPSQEPTVRIGSGHSSGDPSSPTLEDPLIEIAFDDMRLELFAFIEERYVRVATVWMDLALGLGLYADPAGDLNFSIADVAMALSDVRVENADILAEDPAELEAALPTLVSLALPQLTDQLPSVTLPGASELAGFELIVLGARGVRQGANLLPIAGVYADLSYTPQPAGNLLRSTNTEILEVARTGRIIELDVAATAQTPEYQVRIDGGLWSPFSPSDKLVLDLGRALTQGPHEVEVRARAVGAIRSLDPTPARYTLVVDEVPPTVSATLEGAALHVVASDYVSQDRLTYRAFTSDLDAQLTLRDGVIELPPTFAEQETFWLEVEDESQNVTRVLIERDVGIVLNGCRCVGRGASLAGVWGLVLIGVGHGLRRRKRRADLELHA